MRVRQADPGRLLVLEGRLDRTGDEDVRLVLHEAIDNGVGNLVLDVSGVEFIDATGLGVLVAGYRRASRAGRTLLLRDVPPRLARQLAATRLNRVLRSEPRRAATSDVA